MRPNISTAAVTTMLLSPCSGSPARYFFSLFPYPLSLSDQSGFYPFLLPHFPYLEVSSARYFLAGHINHMAAVRYFNQENYLHQEIIKSFHLPA